jgi:hypothetical protein
MHFILHDWQDDKAIEILRNLRPAFKKNYSKLLIHDSVVAGTGADPTISALDLIVMCVLASRERTREDWEKLLRAAGFQVTGVWTDTHKARESIIEAEPLTID